MVINWAGQTLKEEKRATYITKDKSVRLIHLEKPIIFVGEDILRPRATEQKEQNK